MPRKNQEQLERLLEDGDQAAYEQALEERRANCRPRTERAEVRRREEALESLLDNMDLD